eukprot:CAMPEP_0181322764 /NCGR_PEP_ID=MMETSP1101-20121128/19405_1 /TAXON_ID=46948 /ORGANISM="Rhodomonas abbreviata, Strain Caron Lab Isolate" /LENGTH=330 /DNA_ID=CAMNT_0023430705 /DNA_START=189 /DNA_END=1181 /DNA_ORIENTATION=+
MATAEPQALEYEVDDRGRERLKYREEGWNTWVWKGTEETTCAPYEINYVQGGEAGVPIVLVHGFGAHAYHWRYQFPELAKKHKVYSLCLLGYGWSPKAVVPYSMDIWGQQVADFIAEVVQEPAVVCGNSIGGVASLRAASLNQEMVKGLVLLNAAGNFEAVPLSEEERAELEAIAEEKKKGLGGWLASAFQKIASGLIFLSTKSRIGPILKQVYHDEQQVDDDLVRSIQTPAKDPQALAAFREISMQQARIRTTVPEMLDLCKEQLPVLILWGQKDPWMTPARGDSVNRVCEEKGLECEFIPLEAGHCPQDDNPDAVNKELLKWVADRFE